MTKHIETRRKIQGISELDTFEGLLNRSTLSTTDKEILRMHYLEEKSLQFIGDALGFSEITIKQRHRKALRKLATLIK